MDPSWPYYVFLISWIQCIIVVWFAVTIETQSTDVYSSKKNSSTNDSTGVTTAVVEFINTVMPICPPPSKLHLVCDVTLGGKNVTCEERALIIKQCLSRFTGIYGNSNWNTCLNKSIFCQDIVNLLIDENLIQNTDTPTQSRALTTGSGIIEPVTTSDSIINKTPTPKPTISLSTASSSSTTSSSSSNVTMTSSPTTPSIASVTTTTVYRNISILTSPSVPTLDESRLSYIYPIFGTICIILEVILLSYIFCYRKKKFGSPVGRYRRTSNDAMVVNDDMIEGVIEPEPTSPLKALCTNPVYDSQLALKEDERIFNSYLNLRFIDDNSVEGTPEKSLLK